MSRQGIGERGIIKRKKSSGILLLRNQQQSMDGLDFSRLAVFRWRGRKIHM